MMPYHNLGVIDAKMATHRALTQQEWRQKLTMILHAIGLLISDSKNILYFNNLSHY